MTFSIAYVLQIKQKIWIYMFLIWSPKKDASKILSKDLSCKSKCRFDEKECNSDQWWNNDKCLCACKKYHVYEKDYIWNSATCSCQNGKYLASILNEWAIACDEVIDVQAKSNGKETKPFPTNFNEKNITYNTRNFYILLIFLLITIALLIAVNIYLYLINYWAKRKHLLPLYNTNNELKELIYW